MPGIVASKDGPFQYYRYDPSLPAAAAFVGLFALTTILHTYQLARTRAWIMMPLVLGGICETIGYIGRILSSNEAPDFTMGPFLLQNMLLLLAPALYAATIYMALGRLIIATDGSAYTFIKPTLLTALFVSFDISGLAIQGAGAGVMTAGGLDNYHKGEKIVIAGLALLVVGFGLFVIVAVIFDVKMRKVPTLRAKNISLNWRRDLQALYVASALVFARSIVRLIEFSQGNAGWLLRHEWTLYVFDSILMLVVMVMFNVWHLSHVTALLNGGWYSEKIGLKYTRVEAKGNGETMGDELIRIAS